MINHYTSTCLLGNDLKEVVMIWTYAVFAWCGVAVLSCVLWALLKEAYRLYLTRGLWQDVPILAWVAIALTGIACILFGWNFLIIAPDKMLGLI